jgi:hypothetical protein
MFFALTLKRASWLVTVVGLGTFVGSFSAQVIVAPDWVAAVLPTIPKTVLTAVVAAIIAQFALSLAGAGLTRYQGRENKQIRTVSLGAVAGVVGIEGGVVSGVFNLESSGVEASDWRPRHDEPYHEA